MKSSSLILLITSHLIAVLIGVTVWSLQPTHRAFSWVELSELDYLIGIDPRISAQLPEGADIPTMPQYQEAIADLYQTVEGAFYAYATLGSLGSQVVTEAGERFPVFQEEYVSDDYFKARRVEAAAGRLITGDDSGVVLGHEFARRLFGTPLQAVGQEIRLEQQSSAREPEVLEVVGVLAPSRAQDPQLDVDNALVRTIRSHDRFRFFEMQPLHLLINFQDAASVERYLPAVEAWVAHYFNSYGTVMSVNTPAPERSDFITLTRPRIAARRRTFMVFAGLLSLAALLALYAQSTWSLLRQRQLLGVDKALGATRQRLLFRLVLTCLPYSVAGSLSSWGVLWFLPALLPTVFLTHPSAGVLLASLLTPVAALLALAVVVSLPLLRQSSMRLLRGQLKGGYIRWLVILVYGGLALALAGGVAALGVYRQVEQEIGSLQAQFGQIHALQAGNPVIDTRAERAFEAGVDFSPIFTTADAAALRALPQVAGAALAQAIPNLAITTGEGNQRLRAVAADAHYLDVMGLVLSQGDASGCLLSADAAAELSVVTGQRVELSGLTGPIPCVISGILAPYPALWRWLVLDLPDMITPPLDGLGLPLPDYLAQPFASTRILVRLSEPAADAVVAWQRRLYPAVRAEFIPYTPDVAELLASLRIQAQLFLLMALLAAALSVWGIIGGFLALLEAERFQIALDRALGLSVRRIRWRWWLQTFGLGALSTLVGLLGGYLLASQLYNALALDIPNLPAPAQLLMTADTVLALAAALLLLSSALAWLAAHWVSSRSTMSLLKEGAV
jgi:hypothetical protein